MDNGFHERKAKRKAYNEKFVYGWRLRKCTACNGSGRYDSHGSPPCGACDGTGKERYRHMKFPDVETIQRSNRLRLLVSYFGGTFKECAASGKDDDRLLFINSFTLLGDAVKEFEALNVSNPVIKVAFGEKFEKEVQYLRSLQNSLRVRGMVK